MSNDLNPTNLSYPDGLIEKLENKVDDLTRQLTASREECERLTSVLQSNGFRRCDAGACNCGSWHHVDGLAARWAELEDDISEAGHPLCNDNGNLLRNALKELISERDSLRSELSALKQRVEEQEEIIGRLPRTADGVPVTPNMHYWWLHDGVIGDDFVGSLDNSEGVDDFYNCYSTRERAREAAQGKVSE